VKEDLKAVEMNNQKATGAQIERTDGTDEENVKASHITEADIAGIVQSYTLESNEGVGLVFIVDRLVKKQDYLCAYIVFFDVATRKVLHSQRHCAGASKGSFRTHWFKPFKNIVGHAPGIYRELKAQGGLYNP
jgi:hypothetical protein